MSLRPLHLWRMKNKNSGGRSQNKYNEVMKPGDLSTEADFSNALVEALSCEYLIPLG